MSFEHHMEEAYLDGLRYAIPLEPPLSSLLAVGAVGLVALLGSYRCPSCGGSMARAPKAVGASMWDRRFTEKSVFLVSEDRATQIGDRWERLQAMVSDLERHPSRLSPEAIEYGVGRNEDAVKRYNRAVARNEEDPDNKPKTALRYAADWTVKQQLGEEFVSEGDLMAPCGTSGSLEARFKPNGDLSMIVDTSSGEPRLVVVDRKTRKRFVVFGTDKKGAMFWPYGLWGANLFSATTKMSAPSFSLPAGRATDGGTCAAEGFAADDDEDEGANPLFENICTSCVAGDTLIMVKDRGLVRIDVLADEGEEFLAWSGMAWRKTKAVFNGVKPTVELSTSWGHTVRATGDHLIKTSDDGFVACEELEVDDRLVFEPPSSCPFLEDVDLPEIEFGDRYYCEVESNFPKKWSYDVGLLMGYILGDGSITSGDYPTISIVSQISDSDDLRYLEGVVKSWCSTSTETKISKPRPSAFCDDPAEMARISWRVKNLYKFLSALGLDKSCDSSEYSVPKSIFTASRDAVRGFVSGLFSTDGSVSFRTTEAKDKVELSLASVSRTLLSQVQILLMSFGIKSTICEYAKSNKQRQLDGYRDLFKLNISSFDHVVLFRDRIGFQNARKRDKLDAIIFSFRKQRPARVSYPYVKSRVLTGLDEAVYDLVDVGDEHQFVANGISVHNCYALKGHYGYLSNIVPGTMRKAWVRQELDLDPSGAELGRKLAAAISFLARSWRGKGWTKKDGKGRGQQEIGVWDGRALTAPKRLKGKQDIVMEPVLATVLQPGRAKLLGLKPGATTNDVRRLEKVPKGAVAGFFRIHDSGDFSVAAGSGQGAYINAWKTCAELLPHVSFWAPTRIWIFSGNRKTLASDMPPNLAMRPSAIKVNEDPPVVPGLAAGTGVNTSEVIDGQREYRPLVDELGRDALQCPVYSEVVDGKEAKSCMAAKCRVCWLGKNQPVTYGKH